MLESFRDTGLVSILKTDGYVADYVLIFGEHILIHENFYQEIEKTCDKSHAGDSIIQALNQVISRDPPNIMWIQIAQSASLLWCIFPEIESELMKTFERWREYVV